MSILHKAGFAVLALSGLSLAPSAQAQTLTVTSFVSAPVNGAYNYFYSVTPSGNAPSGRFNPSQVTFSFTDPNVFLVSNTSLLTTVFQASPGIFLFYGAPGTVVANGTSVNFVFTSTDSPGSVVGVNSTGTGSVASVNGVTPAPLAVPAAVPEASTTISFGLLLALGLGGVVIAARKKNAASA